MTRRFKAKMEALLDKVVATDRNLVRLHRPKELNKHLAARQAIHDLVLREIQRIHESYD